MASSLQQWESDPLFSAAEVVQDSADRMESIFRLLSHEQDLIQVDHPDTRLVTSIGYHKRDLATILETAKWQLEDFERAVSSLSPVDKTQTREDVISRHWQFISAIKEQIHNVEKSLDGSTTGEWMRNSEWVNFNEQDRDVLASFLTGGNLTDQSSHYDIEDSSILRRFLDPTSSSSLKGDEITEYDGREFEIVKMNGGMHTDYYKENLKDKMDSNFTSRLGLDVSSVEGRHGDDNQLDLEANETAPRIVYGGNKSRAFYNRINIFGLLNNLWSTRGNRGIRNYTKRLKDGEERRYSPTYIDASYSAKGLQKGSRPGSGYRRIQALFANFLANIMRRGTRFVARDQRFPCRVQVNQHSIQMIILAIIALIFVGILLFSIVGYLSFKVLQSTNTSKIEYSAMNATINVANCRLCV